jgi:hypothetical protein
MLGFYNTGFNSLDDNYLFEIGATEIAKEKDSLIQQFIQFMKRIFND